MHDQMPTKILMASLQGDRSYLLVFSALDGARFEVYLPGAGWPGEFTGIRRHVFGSRVLARHGSFLGTRLGS